MMHLFLSSHSTEVVWCQVYMQGRCYFRFSAVLDRALVCVCVCPHSCRPLPLMWAISSHACLCRGIRVDAGYFPGSVCVLIEAISWRVHGFVCGSWVKNVRQEVLLPEKMMSWSTVSCSVQASQELVSTCGLVSGLMVWFHLLPFYVNNT